MGLVTDHQNKANIAIKKKKDLKVENRLRTIRRTVLGEQNGQRKESYAFGEGYKNQNH